MKREKLLLFIIFIASLFLAVGFATVNNTTLWIAGVGGAADNGSVRITNIQKVNNESTSNVTSTLTTQTDTSFGFTATFTIGQNDTADTEHYVTYAITVENDSIYDYVFGPEVFDPQVNYGTAPRDNNNNVGEYDHTVVITGISRGDSIAAKTTITFKVKLMMYTNGVRGNYEFGVNAEVTAEENTEGILAGTITGNTTGDLRDPNIMASFTASVMNSYQRSKEFTFAITNQNFTVVDQNGDPIGNFIIGGSEPGVNYTFYIKRNNGVTFPQDSITLNVYIVPTDEDRSSMGLITLLLDKDQNLTDYEAPTIGNITIEKGNTSRTITVDWSATDNIGVSYYNVYLMNNNDQVIDSVLNTQTIPQTFSNVNNGSYYIKIEAFDAAPNSSTKSTTTETYNWTYTFSVSCNNCNASCTNCTGNNTANVSGTVEAGGTISVTFSGSGNSYNAPNGMNTVSMYNYTTGTQRTLSSSEYTYTNSTFQLQNVTGNVSISADGRSTSIWDDGGCLIEGTKILMADGTYKNVEDIQYDDLLLVYSHEIGDFVYEYPIWIESEKTTDYYQLNTFSDGTTLKTYNTHTVFSVDANEYVDVTDHNKFKIGTRILKVEKINDTYQFKEVSVTNIEIIQEKVKYYDVVTTRYYNSIADGVLTSDGRAALSNWALFEDKLIWSNRRQFVMDNNIQFPYEEYANYLPYYLFIGLRAADGAAIIYYDLMTAEDYSDLCNKLLTNPDMQLLPPTNSNGNRVWMITTSLDDVNDDNKSDFLVEEGSYYTLPVVDGVQKYYSAADNRYYNPGDSIKIIHAMHFIAIK